MYISPLKTNAQNKSKRFKISQIIPPLYTSTESVITTTLSYLSFHVLGVIFFINVRLGHFVLEGESCIPDLNRQT